ncbi:hypothetical protein GIB67_024538 [Kingdonia uniflora]|uniref:Uncharacterized protein n=1 Tax=Kingdonia uniflora TaxID=39325 RepID=A0A7J7LNS0_9MAGN|nr:hypothetical protein GIB67_024538 [Kingdonia uniflora]
MAQSNWEADKMLDVYIYDYLVKRNLNASAKAFMTEGHVAVDPVAIDAPGGFLFEWWSVFWDIFIARTNNNHSDAAASYIETQHFKTREQQQQMQMQQLQLMQHRHAQLQRRDGNHTSIGGPISAMNSEGLLGQSTASVLTAKMYEENLKHPHAMDSETSTQLIDASRMALLKSASNHPGQLVQGNPGSVSAAYQQMQARTQQTTDMKPEVNMSVTQRSLSMDPSSIYGQGMQPKSGLPNAAGLNQGVSGPPLKGWPLTGLNVGAQVQKPFLQNPNQFQLLTPQQQQQLFAHAQAQGSLGSSTNYADMDSRRFRVLPRGNMSTKDVQSSGNDGSIGSPMQSSSPKVRGPAPDQAEYLMKMKMAHMQQSSSQQQQDQLQQPPNNRKRRQPSSSGAANSTGTGNTVGPSPNSPPSTPSTHSPGDALVMTGGLQHGTRKSSINMYAMGGTGGLASSSNQLEDMEHFGDVGSLDDNVESFLSHDDGDGRDLFGTLKPSLTEPNKETSKEFTFSEVGCQRNGDSKVSCCHFSSDGKLLASAGHGKKVLLWNMDTLHTENTLEEHTHYITDVRFRPNTTQLATSSFDKTVRLWNAADSKYSKNQYSGHSAQVMSLDFHPKKTDIFCSCDSNGEIRFWNISQYQSTRVSKGATTQVRFQPRFGQFLAAASEGAVSIFDVETDRKTLTLQGHTARISFVCWDASGDYLASVSQDSVKVWSLATGEVTHDLSSSGNNFNSCVFHPSYSTLMVVGGYQSLELWNMAENKCMTVNAHEGLITALAQSPVTGMVASASHDKTVKLWK